MYAAETPTHEQRMSSRMRFRLTKAATSVGAGIQAARMTWGRGRRGGFSPESSSNKLSAQPLTGTRLDSCFAFHPLIKHPARNGIADGRHIRTSCESLSNESPIPCPVMMSASFKGQE